MAYKSLLKNNCINITVDKIIYCTTYRKLLILCNNKYEFN